MAAWPIGTEPSIRRGSVAQRVKVRVNPAQEHAVSFSFRLLGSFELRQGESTVVLPRSKKARAVLAYVAMGRRPVAREQLSDLFFADTRDPKGGLRWVVSRLRAAVGKDLIEAAPATIGIAGGTPWLDVRELERPVLGNASVEELDRLDRLVRGEFLADLGVAGCTGYEAWRVASQVAINRRHAEVLAELVRKTLGTSAATEYARKLVQLDVSRESSWACLVESLLATNQVPDARHVQRLAVEQLERDGVRLGGKLVAVWERYGAGNRAAAASGSGSTAIGLGLKPRVGVAPCRLPEDGGKRARRVFSEAVFRACNANKTVTVLAPSMSARLDPESGNTMTAARELDVDLLLESSVSRRKRAFHVEVELTDVASAACLFSWQRKLQGSAEDAADALEAYLSARMEIDLPLALIARIREKPPEALTARDRYLLALPRIFSADGLDPVGAYELLEAALSHQPYFGQACCAMSFIRMFLPQYNDNDEQIDITLSLARRAVEICQDDAFVLGIAAVNIAQIERDTDTGLDLTRRALGINPHSVMARLSAAMICHYGGDDAACLRYVDAVEANSETDPITFECHTLRAMAHYQLGAYAEAVKWGRKAVGHNPKHVIALRYLIAGLAKSGNVEAAQALARDLVAVDPSENLAFFERRSAYCSQERLQHLCDGLRLGGLPERG